MSPSEVVRQPSSCVSVADPASCFFGPVAEFGSEAAVGIALWAAALNWSQQSKHAQHQAAN